jgi:hypothetical protein
MVPSAAMAWWAANVPKPAIMAVAIISFFMEGFPVVFGS